MAEVKGKDNMSDRSNKENPFNIEERMGRMEGALGQMGERLNHVETAIGDLEESRRYGTERSEKRDRREIQIDEQNNDNDVGNDHHRNPIRNPYDGI